MVFRCIWNKLCKLICSEMNVLNPFSRRNNDFPDQSLNQTFLEPHSASCIIDSRTPLDEVTGSCNFHLYLFNIHGTLSFRNTPFRSTFLITEITLLMLDLDFSDQIRFMKQRETSKGSTIFLTPAYVLTTCPLCRTVMNKKDFVLSNWLSTTMAKGNRR